MHNLNKTDIILDRAWILKSEKYGGFALSIRYLDVNSSGPFEYQLRKPFEVTIPRFKISDHLTKIFVVSDGHMYRI
jgi:hypothetical protein